MAHQCQPKRVPASADELRRQRNEFLKKLAEVIRKNHAKTQARNQCANEPMSQTTKDQ